MRNSALHFIADLMPPRCSEHSHGIFHTTIAAMSHVGTAALGCPVERSSTVLVLPGRGKRASGLRPEDSRGGCPHIAPGYSGLRG